MKTLLIIICVFLVTSLALGQVTGGQNKDAKTKEELRRLWMDYNEAGTKRDRAALEQLFADEYVWIQANGSVRDKTKHINGILGNSADFSAPMPSFDQLFAYGDVAVSRVTENGLSASTIYAKRNGRWQFVQAQSTRLPPERKSVELNADALDSFVGKYEFTPGAVGTVTKESNALMWQGGRRPKARLIPLSDNHFAVENTDIEIIFHKNDTGQVARLDFRQGICQESKAKRVK